MGKRLDYKSVMWYCLTIQPASSKGRIIAFQAIDKGSIPFTGIMTIREKILLVILCYIALC